jgi:hypothetical protein
VTRSRVSPVAGQAWTVARRGPVKVLTGFMQLLCELAEKVAKDVLDWGAWAKGLPVTVVILNIMIISTVECFHGYCLCGVLQSQIWLRSVFILFLYLEFKLVWITLQVVAFSLRALLFSCLKSLSVPPISVYSCAFHLLDTIFVSHYDRYIIVHFLDLYIEVFHM